MQKSIPFTVLSISLAATLLGCGGGGGGGSTGTTTSGGVTTFNGKVIDGYISGATVCLDVNSNNICDRGIDPSAISAPDGSYSFTYSGGDISGMHVIAEVGIGAIDADLGPVTTSYSLMAPVANVSAITPLTTLVSSEMKSSNGSVSAEQAQDTVKANLGLKTTILGVDVTKDANSLAVSQVLTAAIAQTNKELTAKTSSLNAGEAMKQSILEVKNSLAKRLISTAGQATVTLEEAKQVASENIVISGKIDNIIAQSKSGNGDIVSMADAFRAGIVSAEINSGDYIDNSGRRVNGNWTGFKNALRINYMQFDIDNLPVAKPDFERVLVGNAWFKKYQSNENWTFDGSEWVLSTDIGSSQSKPAKPTISANCVTVPMNEKGTVSKVYCAKEKDLSNKPIANFIPNLCKDGDRQITGCSADALFPANSKGYDLTQSTISKLTGDYNGYFELWPSIVQNEWSGYCTSDDCNTSGSLFDFIAYIKTRPQFRGNNCNTAFKVLSFDSAKNTGQMSWSNNANTAGCSGATTDFSKQEITNFVVIKIGGKDVLIAETAALYRRNNPSYNENYTIYASLKSSIGVTGIWSGTYDPVSIKNSIPFTGDPYINTQILNRAALDAILAQKKLAAFPYP